VNRGLVLSGGGVRGAYEVGVVQGIQRILEQTPFSGPPFSIFTGTSAGAINAAFLASNAHREDLNIRRLAETWKALRLEDHLRLRPLALLKKSLDRSLVNVKPLAQLIESSIDWKKLRENVQNHTVHALMVAALEISRGRTTIFAELSPGTEFPPSRDPRRVHVEQPITLEHVLASASIPIVFPPQRIGNCYFCDGGLRFNTPIAPAIRVGADRLIVISVRYRSENVVQQPVCYDTPNYPNIAFLVGKLLNALLLDPVEYDLHVLERFNQIIQVMEDELDEDQLAAIRKVMAKTRGLHYRRIETLVFMPSEDISGLAAKHLEDFPPSELSWLARQAVAAASRASDQPESDVMSYLLFDGGFTTQLIELGERDAMAKAAEVRAFFDVP
jgi:NTE family protein